MSLLLPSVLRRSSPDLRIMTKSPLSPFRSKSSTGMLSDHRNKMCKSKHADLHLLNTGPNVYLLDFVSHFWYTFFASAFISKLNVFVVACFALSS